MVPIDVYRYSWIKIKNDQFCVDSPNKISNLVLSINWLLRYICTANQQTGCVIWLETFFLELDCNYFFFKEKWLIQLMKYQSFEKVVKKQKMRLAPNVSLNTKRKGNRAPKSILKVTLNVTLRFIKTYWVAVLLES